MSDWYNQDVVAVDLDDGERHEALCRLLAAIVRPLEVLNVLQSI